MSALDLADAKIHLNLSGTTHDDELQSTIDEAEGLIARRCGPLEAVSTSERVRGYGSALALSTVPVVSVIAVTSLEGDVVDTDDLWLDEDSGLVTFTDGTEGFPSRLYDVEYEAGRSEIPADLLRAVKELVKHLWRTQRGSSSKPGGGAGESPAPTYLLPYAVAELLEPYDRPMGFA